MRVALAEAQVLEVTKADLAQEGVDVSRLEQAAAAAGHGDKEVCSLCTLLQL